MAQLSVPDGFTFWSSTIQFFRDRNSDKWMLSIRQWDGRDIHVVDQTTGIGPLTDHVLGECYDSFEAYTDGLAMRMGGIQHFLPFEA
jgi:hypothetical protein